MIFAHALDIIVGLTREVHRVDFGQNEYVHGTRGFG
jgi:hypothetical protein